MYSGLQQNLKSYWKGPLMPEITCAGLTDQGRIRKRNEDSIYTDPDQGLFIVSDGMGGHAAGDVASQMVVQILPKLIHKEMQAIQDLSDPKTIKHLWRALTYLNDEVRKEGMKKSARNGMGATVVLLLIRGPKALIAHMGDSRLYLLRKKHLIQLTKDHSIVQQLIDAGKITPAEAAVHPARSQITNCIGMPRLSPPGAHLLNIAPGDRFLLCSDGLTGMVRNEGIAGLLNEIRDIHTACQALVDAANVAGGIDNIAVVLVDWNGIPTDSTVKR